MNTLLISFITSAVLSLNPVDARQDKVITRLIGRQQTITITATGDGARYSVVSVDGRTLVAGATLDELREKHPASYQQIRATIATTDRALDITSTILD